MGPTSCANQPPPFSAQPFLTPLCLYLRAQRVCTGSSTIHTCQLCHLKGTAEATCKHKSSSGDQMSASSVCLHGEPTCLTSESVGSTAAQPQTALAGRWGRKKPAITPTAILLQRCPQCSTGAVTTSPPAKQDSNPLNLPFLGKGTGWLEHTPRICCTEVIQAWQGCCKALRWFIISRPRAKT